MMCSRCKKRIAVVYISRLDDGKTVNEGICLQCAKELGIAPVNDIMEKMGISEDELDAMSEELTSAFEDGDEDFLGKLSSLSFTNMPGMNADVEPEKKDKKSKDTKKTDKSKKTSKDMDDDSVNKKYLSQYCTDLTLKARENKLDNVIGREDEIYRLIQILNRRTKNNPCLIGEPGVGKTAIAEGLAIRIAEKRAPARLLDKEVHLLDLTALVAGTQFRGQFESRVKGLIEEVKRLGNIILVIDEVHNLVGTGDTENSMNAANMLKPALSRGEIQVIGATTLSEYRKYIEKDSALERRFQPIMVEEPSIEDSVEIIKGIKEYYENYHNVKITDAIIRKAVALSERYINDRFLPDKAIDLIDEAGSNAGLKNINTDKLYIAKKEKNKCINELDELEQATEDINYERIAELKVEIARLEKHISEIEKDLIKPVTVDDLAKVIELWTGISSGKIMASEVEKLSGLSAELKKHIVGQDEAIEVISAATKRARAALVPRKRPVSFIFTGPTGVGKTELVKVLSRQLFDSPETLIRLDMSEFMEKHSVSRIIGSPPGYVGYDDAGQLTEKIRRRPYSVVLFDEIEKAHPDVLNILLQVLDDGRITDAHGKTVSFENTVIIMTSNAGSNIKGTAAGFNKTINELDREKAMKALSEFLRPEFINRVDEIVVFKALEKEAFDDIVKIHMDELKNGLKEREIELDYSENAIKLLAEKSYSSVYGARNVRRIVQKEVEDALVNLVIDANEQLKKVFIDEKDGKLVFEQ